MLYPRTLSLCLLLSSGLCADTTNTTPSTTHTTRSKMQPIKLESPAIKAIDGTPFVHIGNMMYIGKQLNNMLSKTPTLYFTYDDTYRTINELSELEALYTSRNEMTSELQDAFNDARHQALHTFVQISGPYVEEIKAVKNTMIHIITEWSKKRERPETYLLAWANIEGDEEKALYEGVTNFQNLKRFVEDLCVFMMDLTYNFEKSFREWKQQHKSHG